MNFNENKFVSITLIIEIKTIESKDYWVLTIYKYDASWQKTSQNQQKFRELNKSYNQSFIQSIHTINHSVIKLHNLVKKI